MTRVRCILVETTVPVRIRPRMETRPVKGHFLSRGVLLALPYFHQLDPSSCTSKTGSSETDSNNQVLLVPMYVPSIAVFGVLNPSPTSLNHLRPPFPTLLLLALLTFELTKMCGCFWKARSDCTVNSVAILAMLSDLSIRPEK